MQCNSCAKRRMFVAEATEELAGKQIRAEVAQIHSVSCSWILSSLFIGISTTICSFIGAPHNFNTSLRLQLKTFL